MWAKCLVAHDKRATMSESLRLLTKKKQTWANLSGRSPKIATVNKSPRSLTKNEGIAHSLYFFLQKTSNSLSKRMIEFPTLLGTQEFPKEWNSFLSCGGNDIVHYRSVNFIILYTENKTTNGSFLSLFVFTDSAEIWIRICSGPRC